MNSHLNLFRTYTKENRRYQLENDLTRALAISLQEDSLFLHEVLHSILEENMMGQLFNDSSSSNNIDIQIQLNNFNITEVDQIVAVSLSEHIMTADHFWKQNHQVEYDCICDIVIRIDNIAIIIEAKRDTVDCTAQLYNQAFNIYKNNRIDEAKDEFEKKVTPRDLNWAKLMQIAVKVNNIKKATKTSNRFISDFIDLVFTHNHTWFPEVALNSISNTKSPSIYRRFETAINELCKSQQLEKLHYPNRLGIRFRKPWAQEILFSTNDKGSLVVAIYPGNTKQQGSYLFQHDPKVKANISVNGSDFEVDRMYHIKFSSFQRYFAGLWFYDDKLKVPLYTNQNFWKYCGRNYIGKNWSDLELLFNDSFISEFDWKDQCKWGTETFNKKTQFDLSFGYELSCEIPFEMLKQIDTNQKDISGLTQLIGSIYNEFEHIYEL